MRSYAMDKDVIAKQLEIYQKVDKVAKGEILNHLESVLNRPRKSIIRSLNNQLKKQSKYSIKAKKAPCQAPLLPNN